MKTRHVTAVEPPKDRAIKMVANIVLTVGACTEVGTWEGEAQWSEASQDWTDCSGMSIRLYFEAKLIILEWRELSELNECRLFMLVGSSPIVRLAPSRPVLAALPAPAWHTSVGDCDWEAQTAFSRKLTQLTDSALVALSEAHHRWCEFYYYDNHRRIGLGAARLMTSRESSAAVSSYSTVRDILGREMAYRFKRTVENRDRALRIARDARKRKALA